MMTFVIIGLTVLASFYAWKNQDVYRKWLMNPYLASRQKQYLRFLTSGFIHADQTHLFVNMLSFYFFGRNLEAWFAWNYGFAGRLIFAGFYILAIIISEIPTFLKHKNNYNYNSVGASGAVSAVIFSYIIINPLDNIYLFFIIGLPAFVFGFLFLLYSYYASTRQSDLINHDAHFYGAVFGILFIGILSPEQIGAFFQQIASFRL